jgi:UPF0755 protein
MMNIFLNKLKYLSVVFDPRKSVKNFSLLIIFFLIIIPIILLSPPVGFPVAKVVSIEEGTIGEQVGEILKTQKIIRSETIFRLWLKFKINNTIIAGDYYFSRPMSLPKIVYHLTTGNFGLVPIKITIPEGATITDISMILDKQLPDFDQARFLELTDGLEGYLFPDTYYFTVATNEEKIIKRMRRNFNRKIAPVTMMIEASGRSLSEIIIMASLLELEAQTDESRKMIADILWRRLDTGMRLQVDAVFPYIVGKNTFQLSQIDLRHDSPYNTYRYEGLPIGAICNPGLNSIEAAIFPIESDYWYYLSDLSGNMHYAVTHDEHVRNKFRYLK